MNKHNIAEAIKKLLIGKVETYPFNKKTLKFQTGTRPVRRKYISSTNDVVRNDVLQIEFFEKNFKRDDILWDIGSHHGHYSIFAGSVAKGANQVFSFEPDPAARKIQAENIALNDLGDRIIVSDLAVSDTNGSISFDASFGNSNSHIVKQADGRKVNMVSVPTKTIDTLVDELPAPSFVKIDVEGAEIDVLSAASRLLDNKNVRFICELHPFAWDRFKVQYGTFEELLKKYNRKVTLLDQQRTLADLPYYGTVLF